MSSSNDNTTTLAAAVARVEADVRRPQKEKADFWQQYESETARLEREKQAIIDEAEKKQNTPRQQYGKMAAAALKAHKKLEDKLAIALTDNEELRQENDHLTENRNLYSVELQGMDEIEVENEELKNWVERLEARNEDLQALNDEMQERITLWNNEYDYLKGAKEGSNPLVRHWDITIKELTAEFASLKFIVVKQSGEGENLPAGKDGSDVVGPYKKKIKELKEDVKMMSFIAEKTQEQYEDLFTANNNNKSTILQYKEDMALMKQQYDDLEAANGGTDAVVGPYNREIKKLNNEIRELNFEAEMLRSVAENMTKKWKDSCTANETNIGTILQYKSEMALMRQQYEDMVKNKDEIIGKFIAKIKEHEAKIKQQLITVDQSKDFIVVKEAIIAERDILIKGLEMAMVKQQKTTNTQEATIKQQNDTIHNHTGTIERQRQQLESHRENLPARDSH